MSNKYTTNKNAIADCDVCGFQFKLKTLKSGKSYKKRQEDISKKMDAQYKSDVKKFKDDKKGLKEGGMVIVDRNYLKGK